MTGNLVALLSYGNLPSAIYEKNMDAIISLVQRSNKWADKYSDRINPFVHRLLECHLLDILQQYNESESRSKLERLIAASVEDMFKTNEITDNIANEFGLPTATEMRSKSNKRRVIRGLEDGDVRLIENAVGNLNILE
jgi:hypothetical protein